MENGHDLQETVFKGMEWIGLARDTQGFSQLAEDLLTSYEGRCSVELVRLGLIYRV